MVVCVLVGWYGVCVCVCACVRVCVHVLLCVSVCWGCMGGVDV